MSIICGGVLDVRKPFICPLWKNVCSFAREKFNRTTENKIVTARLQFYNDNGNRYEILRARTCAFADGSTIR